MQYLEFPIQIVEAEEGGYYVTCPVLQGCYSQGETMEEAKANIREAIEVTLYDMKAHNEPIPDFTQGVTTSVGISFPEPEPVM